MNRKNETNSLALLAGVISLLALTLMLTKLIWVQ
jgi:hypothetical protein